MEKRNGSKLIAAARIGVKPLHEHLLSWFKKVNSLFFLIKQMHNTYVK